jgi:hypothetical protein
VDLNAQDEASGRTALFEACAAGDLQLLRAFAPGSDRLDLFAGAAKMELQQLQQPAVSVGSPGSRSATGADADAGAGAGAAVGAMSSKSQRANVTIPADRSSRNSSSKNGGNQEEAEGEEETKGKDTGISIEVSGSPTVAVAPVSAKRELVEVVTTPLNIALTALNIDMVKELVSMRRNDVIQQLLQVSDQSAAAAMPPSPTPFEIPSNFNVGGNNDFSAPTTLLYALERQNSLMGAKVGIVVPPAPVVEAAVVPPPPVVAHGEEGGMSGGGEEEEEEAGEEEQGGGENFGEGEGEGVEEEEGFAHEEEEEVFPAAAAGEEKGEVSLGGGGGSPAAAGKVAAIDLTDAQLLQAAAVTASMENVLTESTLADLDVIEQSGIGGRVIRDRKNDLAKFNKSTEILKVLIELVNGSGVVDESDHFHTFYFNGMM